jgi:hypothetical protein
MLDAPLSELPPVASETEVPERLGLRAVGMDATVNQVYVPVIAPTYGVPVVAVPLELYRTVLPVELGPRLKYAAPPLLVIRTVPLIMDDGELLPWGETELYTTTRLPSRFKFPPGEGRVDCTHRPTS